MVYTLSGVRFPAVPSAYKLGNHGWNSPADRTARVSFISKNKSICRKIFSGKSFESFSQLPMATKSEKVLVPGTENNEPSSPTDGAEVIEAVSDDSQISGKIKSSEIKLELKLEDQENIVELGSNDVITEEDSSSVELQDEDGEAEAEGTSDSPYEAISDESVKIRGKIIPPPGNGQRIYEIDPMLKNHHQHLDYRYEQYRKLRAAIDKNEGGLEKFSRGYEKFGFIRSEAGITYREWAPGAKLHLDCHLFSNKLINS